MTEYKVGDKIVCISSGDKIKYPALQPTAYKMYTIKHSPDSDNWFITNETDWAFEISDFIPIHKLNKLAKKIYGTT